jgi:hypothetical protein
MKRESLCLLVIGAASACVAAAAAEEPRLKPGLWEMHYRSSSGGEGSALPPTVCLGARTDEQRQLEQDNVKSRCGRYESREKDGKWVIDAECTARGRTVTKQVVTSLAGDTFREENYSPQASSSSDGKWLGPCKPGQKPDAFK